MTYLFQRLDNIFKLTQESKLITCCPVVNHSGKTKIEDIYENRQENGPVIFMTGKDRKSSRANQNRKRSDRKVKSSDSPEIRDTGKASDIPMVWFVLWWACVRACVCVCVV